MNQIRDDSSVAEYAQAMGSVRTAKNLFAWLLALAILVQLAAFVAVHYFGILDAIHGAASAATTQSTQGAAVVTDEGVEAAEFWQYILYWCLPATKFIALVSCLLLVVMLTLAVKISLIGRLGGVASLISSLLWSILLLAMVTPWQQVLRAAVACGALYNLGELVGRTSAVKAGWGAANVSMMQQVLYYARFIGYPVVAMLVWLIVQVKFARSRRPVEVPLPATEEPAKPEAE
ncbi:MAG: hypothetical protein SVT52_06975 [Planctomycetota bacterium]|nr:hypothetical protein [Planctomycetota bacterium]